MGAPDGSQWRPLSTLAERWSTGTWTRQVTPNPSGATETVLEGVSCAAWNACVGVGYESDYFDFWDGLGPQGGVLPYAVRWNGS